MSVTDGRGRPVRDGGLARWLARVAPERARGEVAIALVSDARMRTLNRSYRRKDYATDVLSFISARGAPPPRARARGRRSAALPSGRSREPQALSEIQHLGDVVIATGVAKRQAREAGHAYATELRVLALHGLLHLLGYDHDDPADGGRMARMESRLRRKGGLRTGLIERMPEPAHQAARATRGRQGRRPSREARERAGMGRHAPRR